VLTCFAQDAVAQTRPSAAALLQEVQANYVSMTTYSSVGEITSVIGPSGSKSTVIYSEILQLNGQAA